MPLVPYGQFYINDTLRMYKNDDIRMYNFDSKHTSPSTQHTIRFETAPAEQAQVD